MWLMLKNGAGNFQGNIRDLTPVHRAVAKHTDYNALQVSFHYYPFPRTKHCCGCWLTGSAHCFFQFRQSFTSALCAGLCCREERLYELCAIQELWILARAFFISP